MHLTKKSELKSYREVDCPKLGSCYVPNKIRFLHFIFLDWKQRANCKNWSWTNDLGSREIILTNIFVRNNLDSWNTITMTKFNYLIKIINTEGSWFNRIFNSCLPGPMRPMGMPPAPGPPIMAAAVGENILQLLGGKLRCEKRLAPLPAPPTPPWRDKDAWLPPAGYGGERGPPPPVGGDEWKSWCCCWVRGFGDWDTGLKPRCEAGLGVWLVVLSDLEKRKGKRYRHITSIIHLSRWIFFMKRITRYTCDLLRLLNYNSMNFKFRRGRICMYIHDWKEKIFRESTERESGHKSGVICTLNFDNCSSKQWQVYNT